MLFHAKIYPGKTLIFGLPQRSSTSMKNIVKQTNSLLYFQVRFIGEATTTEVPWGSSSAL